MKPGIEKVIAYFMTFALLLFGAGLIGLWVAIVKMLLRFWGVGNPL